MCTITRKDRSHATGVRRIALLALIAALALGSCAPADDGWKALQYEPTPYYDSSCFVPEGDRIVYEGPDAGAYRTGVDVSDHQGAIDWQAVAADGISFAFVRIGWRGNTEGYVHVDERFEQNLSGAQAAGISCGVYFYSQALSEEEAQEEARFVLSLLGSRELEYPVVFDYEPGDGNRLVGLDDATATACARVFCSTIVDAGYEPMIYGNTYDLQRLDLSELSDCRIWYAQYAAFPSREDAFAIWQYSSSGHVDGISTPADLNLDLGGVY